MVSLETQYVIPVVNSFEFTNNVVLGNDIIEAFPSLTTLQIKLFNMSVSAINTNEENDNPGVVYLSKDKLLSALKFEGQNKNTYLKNKFNEFADLKVYFELKGEPKSIHNVITSILWDFPDNNDLIQVHFNPKLLDSLFNLKNYFTQYRVSECLALDSSYSILLFQHLMMSYNKGKHFNNQHLMNPTISIDDFRKITHTQDKYVGRINNLKSRVIEPAIEEISEKTNISIKVDYKVNSKRQTTHIQFHIEEAIGEYENINIPEGVKYRDTLKIYLEELNSGKNSLLQYDSITPNDIFLLEMIIGNYGEDNFLSAIRHCIIEGIGLGDLRFIDKLLSYKHKNGVFPEFTITSYK
ncbi:replication initiation protein [Erysipelothrix rhusiopathiae]|nr:replication initiation protein [Erysipelothrix rhusiopathiae]